MPHLGIDFGGTKIEAAALDAGGQVLNRVRVPNPGSYDAAIKTVCDLVAKVEIEVGTCSVGMGTPGSVSPVTGLMRNSNSVYLNGRPFHEDVSVALGREVRIANDANCFALSEAVDGAGQGASVVFGIILGTGCGGGVVVNGQLLNGASGIAGEWGHNPLPWSQADDICTEPCYCGKTGCLEQWISGTGLQRDHAVRTGEHLSAEEIITRMRGGDAAAIQSFNNLVHRLGRALAAVCNVIDPDVIVVGGGLSNVSELYTQVPDVVRQFVFSDVWNGKILPAKWGDSSGVRGAARLWAPK